MKISNFERDSLYWHLIQFFCCGNSWNDHQNKATFFFAQSGDKTQKILIADQTVLTCNCISFLAVPSQLTVLFCSIYLLLYFFAFISLYLLINIMNETSVICLQDRNPLSMELRIIVQPLSAIRSEPAQRWIHITRLKMHWAVYD